MAISIVRCNYMRYPCRFTMVKFIFSAPVGPIGQRCCTPTSTPRRDEQIGKEMPLAAGWWHRYEGDWDRILMSLSWVVKFPLVILGQLKTVVEWRFVLCFSMGWWRCVLIFWIFSGDSDISAMHQIPSYMLWIWATHISTPTLENIVLTSTFALYINGLERGTCKI